MGERLLEPFQTYGWRPDENLSEDENFVDLLLLVTRSSRLAQGSMACIIVRPPSNSSSKEHVLDRIQSVATNQALYKPNNSDIHAEIAAIGDAARHGRPTDQCTAYITMPPCRKCFPALVAAGIARVVSGLRPPEFYASFPVIKMEGVANQGAHRRRVQALVDAHDKNKEEGESKKRKMNNDLDGGNEEENCTLEE